MMEKIPPQKIWTDEFKIFSFNVNREGKADIPMLCRYMQETAHNHADNLGVGYAFLKGKNLVWVLRGQRVRVERFPGWGDRIKIQTWPSGKDKLYYYRDFRFLSEDGERLGFATTKWMVVEVGSRRPQRSDSHFDFELWHNERVYGEEFIKPESISQPEFRDSIEVRWSDIDIYQHVNNAVYIEYIIEAQRRRFNHQQDLKEIKIEYAAEAVYGDRISLEGQRISDFRCLYRLTRERDSKTICTAETVWAMREEKI